MRSTCRDINELIVTGLNRLSAEIPVNVETLGDRFSPLESLESAQISYQLETERIISTVSVLHVDVNRLLEVIPTSASDAQEKAIVGQLSQETTVTQRFMPINREDAVHHLPSIRGDQPSRTSAATTWANPPPHYAEDQKPNPRDLSFFLADCEGNTDYHCQMPIQTNRCTRHGEKVDSSNEDELERHRRRPTRHARI